MSTTVAVTSESRTPAVARRDRRHRRCRVRRSQATSSAGRGLNENEDEGIMEGGEMFLSGMISREFRHITLEVVDHLMSRLRTEGKDEYREPVRFPPFN